MVSKRPHRIDTAWPACRWSWLATGLALLGMLLPVSGWQVSAQFQSLCFAGNAADEGEDEGGDSDDGDLEAHLLFRRSPRESLPPGLVGEASQPLNVGDDAPRGSHALHADRAAATLSAARLPLRC